MATEKLPLGNTSNLDIDDQSSQDGENVALYNMYQDRSGAFCTFPPHVLYCDTEAGNLPVYAYDAPDKGFTLIVCNGRVFTQNSDSGPLTEVTGAVLTIDAVPTFTEDTEAVFFAADSVINRYVFPETTVTQVGTYVAPTADDPLELGVFFSVNGDESSYRVVTLVSDQAKEIRYTTDGTVPTASSTLYDLPVVILADTTLKAVAIDNDDVVSAVTSEHFVVNVTDTTKPSVIAFNASTVYDNEVEIATLNGIPNDLKKITAWCITESSSAPLLNDPKWTETKPVRYRHRSAAAATVDLYAWARDAAGNVSNAFTKQEVIFLAADTVPDPFTFTDLDVSRGQVAQSEAISIDGLTFDTTISVSNGEYALSHNNGATWTNWRTAAGTFTYGDVVRVRHTASTSLDTETVTTLTIGTVEGTFTSTTIADQTPRNVTTLVYTEEYLKSDGNQLEGDVVPGDTFFSIDKDNNYSAWSSYNNQSKGDALKSIIVAFDQVYNIGTRSLEVSFNDGVTPWALNKNASQPFGTPAPHSVVFDGENIYYITEAANSRKVVRIANGGAAETISFPIDIPIERMASVADAQSFVLGFRGQNFYVINFPSADVTIDEQHYQSVTLAYHLQKKAWIVLGKWDAENAIYGQYRGISSCYIERYGKMLIGGRDGKLYTLAENDTVDYTITPQLLHRWRDDHIKTWKNPRNIKLYPVGKFRLPDDETQGGLYRYRQHELSYTDLSDAGEIFRAAIKSGHISYGKPLQKRCNRYQYDILRGSNKLVINSIHEDVDMGTR